MDYFGEAILRQGLLEIEVHCFIRTEGEVSFGSFTCQGDGVSVSLGHAEISRDDGIAWPMTIIWTNHGLPRRHTSSESVRRGLFKGNAFDGAARMS